MIRPVRRGPGGVGLGGRVGAMAVASGRDELARADGSVAARSAWSRSAMRSSTCSRPTDSRTRSSVAPVAAAPRGELLWVVLAGWMIRLFASPTLASRLKT